MRITKKLAESITKELMTTKRESVTFSMNILKKAVTEAVKKTIPVDVLHVFDKHPDYLKTNSSWYIRNVGFSSHESVCASQTLPTLSSTITVQDSDAANIRALKDEWESQRDKYKESFKQLESIIFAFRTTDKLIKAIPEAEQFVPKENDVSGGLALNITEIQSLYK